MSQSRVVKAATRAPPLSPLTVAVLVRRRSRPGPLPQHLARPQLLWHRWPTEILTSLLSSPPQFLLLQHHTHTPLLQIATECIPAQFPQLSNFLLDCKAIRIARASSLALAHLLCFPANTRVCYPAFITPNQPSWRVRRTALHQSRETFDASKTPSIADCIAWHALTTLFSCYRRSSGPRHRQWVSFPSVSPT